MIFESHPGRRLIEHLIEVRDIGMTRVRAEMRETYNIVGLTHDFGKYTKYFQKYLKDKEKRKESNHAFISALFGTFVALDRGMGDEIPLLIFSTIIHHHGRLKNIQENIANTFLDNGENKFNSNLSEKIEIAYKQILALEEQYYDIVHEMEILGLEKEFEKFIKDKPIEDTLIKLKKIQHRLKKKNNIDLYFYHHEIYSALISSDKLSAAGLGDIEITQVNIGEIDEIRERKFRSKSTSEINNIRNSIYNEVQKNIVASYNSSNIFTITSPTGTGKTITGIYAGARLRDKLNLKGKLIYVMPFTSIVDQNYEVIKSILEELEYFEGKESRFITKHHNLTTKTYKDNEYEYDSNQSEILIEDWKSDIVVTTFVQFLESIISNRNRMLKKYHNFRDSVIIMDEVQSLDIAYYKLVEEVINKMCEIFNMKVIMMTATKPMILENGVELLKNHEEYYKKFNRTKIEYYPEHITMDKFIENCLACSEDKSYMIVVNTINQSMKVYEELRKLDREVYYLSTNIIPKDRKEIIENIRGKLKKGEKPILVTTQIVEAGVDLDFNEVIRDIGPIDSIIQCAGRCNRENRKDFVGEVKVFNVLDDNDKLYGGYVYGNTSIGISQKILKEYGQVEEKDYLEMIQEYFQEVISKKNQEASMEFLKSMKEMVFTDRKYSIDKFSLIKNTPNYIDVVVVVDEVVEKALNDYAKEKDRYKRKELNNIIKNYTLSIPLKCCKNLEDLYEGTSKIVRRDKLEFYYNKETGFKRDSVSEDSRIFL